MQEKDIKDCILKQQQQHKTKLEKFNFQALFNFLGKIK